MTKRALLALFALAWMGTLLAAAGCSKANPESVAAEIAAREAFAKRVLREEDAGRALGISSTSEIVFDEGFSPINYDPADSFRNYAFRWMGQNAHVRLKPRPGRPMRLHIQGWVSEKVIKAKAVMSLTIDGEPVGTIGPIQDGHYWFDTVVKPDVLRREWVDLNIHINAVAFHWADPPALMVALSYDLRWTEAD